MLAFLALMLCAGHSVNGGEAGTAQDLVSRAAALHALRAAPGGAFHLKVHVKLLGLVNGDKEGEVVFLQETPERYFVQMRFPGFSELSGVSDTVRWRKRSSFDKPFRMHQMTRALNLASHLRLAAGATIVKEWDTTRGGTALACITVRPSPDFWQRERAGQAALPPIELDQESKVSLCFDKGSGALAMVDYGTPLPRFEYEGAMRLGEGIYPKTARCYEGGDLAVEAVVEELAVTERPPGDDAWAPPEGADRWPVCAAPVPPRVISKKLVGDASFTKIRRIFGTVICFAEVGPDGLLHDLAAVQVRQGDLYMLAKEAAETLRYQPATCNGTPVPFELFLAYRFTP